MKRHVKDIDATGASIPSKFIYMNEFHAIRELELDHPIAHVDILDQALNKSLTFKLIILHKAFEN